MADMKNYLAQWPRGVIRSLSELERAGISKRLIHAAVKQNVIQSVGYGGYARGEDRLSWQHGLYALQRSSSVTTPLYFLGGLAAFFLHLEGRLTISPTPYVFFHVDEDKPFPPWFKCLAGLSIELTGSSASFSCYCNRLPLHVPDTFTTFCTAEGLAYQVSSPERALLETQPTRKNFTELLNFILNIAPLKEKILTRLLQSAFPTPMRLQFLKKLAESLANNGRIELFESLSKFLPGEDPHRTWFPLHGRSTMNIQNQHGDFVK